MDSKEKIKKALEKQEKSGSPYASHRMMARDFNHNETTVAKFNSTEKGVQYVTRDNIIFVVFGERPLLVVSDGKITSAPTKPRKKNKKKV